MSVCEPLASAVPVTLSNLVTDTASKTRPVQPVHIDQQQSDLNTELVMSDENRQVLKILLAQSGIMNGCQPYAARVLLVMVDG